MSATIQSRSIPRLRTTCFGKPKILIVKRSSRQGPPENIRLASFAIAFFENSFSNRLGETLIKL